MLDSSRLRTAEAELQEASKREQAGLLGEALGCQKLGESGEFCRVYWG